MLTNRWRKSTRSDNGNCVEARRTGPVQVRDTKHPDGAVLSFKHNDWAAFIAWLKDNNPAV